MSANLLALYKKLYNLVQKEDEILAEEDYEELTDLLQEKNKVIERIEAADLLTFLKDRDDPEEDFHKMKEIMQKCRDLEDENISNLQKKKEEVKKNLGELKNLSKTRNKYLQQNMDAKFIDKKS
ncbi:MAG: hypothetical protein ACOC5A_04855 [Halanaerobiales bacterium]